MLGLGWTEMLVIGVVALIVIGPKDLPVVMNRIGKIAGQIRRMGNEFQREINKTTGLDEVRNLRNSITAPLKKTSDEIRKEFNAMTPTGPKPSGALKPADPKAESVVDEIKAAAGMTPPKTAAAKPAAAAPKAATARSRKPAAKKAPVKAKAAPTRPVIATDLAPLDAPAPARKPAASSKPAAKKPAAKATPTKKPTKAAAAAEASPAPKKRAAARPKSAARPKPAATEAAKAGDA